MRDLGVLFDSELTTKKHIAKVAAVCFFHIRRLRQIRRRIGKYAIRFVQALITPRLDYCNSMLASLYRNRHFSCYIECRTPLFGVVTISRHTGLQLHWLSLRSRVQFKLRILMHSIHNKSSPSYLSDTVQTVATRCGLRSSATTDYVVPWTHSKLKFSKRAFAYACPAAWNGLPEHICGQSTPATFRRL